MSISSRAGLAGDGGKQIPRDRGHSSVVAISAAIVTPKHNQVRQPDRAYARSQSTHMWTGGRPHAIGG
jgi:hypothetical protein